MEICRNEPEMHISEFSSHFRKTETHMALKTIRLKWKLIMQAFWRWFLVLQNN